MRKALVTGMKYYFDLYLQRYGFRHPEDPYRTKSDGVLPANVITCKGANQFDTYTTDEMPTRVYL